MQVGDRWANRRAPGQAGRREGHVVVRQTGGLEGRREVACRWATDGRTRRAGWRGMQVDSGLAGWWNSRHAGGARTGEQTDRRTDDLAHDRTGG